MQVAIVQKSVEDSKLPDEVKKLAAAAKNPVYGKVSSLWPMSNGTLLFEISTDKGGVAFALKTGDPAHRPVFY